VRRYDSRSGGRRRQGPRHPQTARQILVENNITREHVLALQITHPPAYTMLLITHKDSLEALEPCLPSKFAGNSNETLTPPNPKMGDIRLCMSKDLVGSHISSKSRGRETVTKVL
jgi:hypothetical protein